MAKSSGNNRMPGVGRMTWERSGDDRMSNRSSVSPHHSLYLELPCEIRRIWKCPWPHVCWAMSEVSGALRALLIKSQVVKEIPGITSWGTALTHPPKLQCGQKDIGDTTAWGGGTALLIPANPSLPLKSQLQNHWRCLWMQYTDPSTQGGSQTLSPSAEARSCIPLSTPSFLKKDVRGVSSFAVAACQEQVRECSKVWHLSPALSQEVSRWG